MNNERFLVFDIDDTLYSQMEPLLTACEFSLGRKLPVPGAVLPDLREKKR